jgi:UDP-2,3-diacylglucosamine pyrophosphatase LpxH
MAARIQNNQSQLDEQPYFSCVSYNIARGSTNADISRLLWSEYQLDASPDTIRRFRKRHGLNIPGVEKVSTRINGDEAEAVCEASMEPILDDPDTMLRQRGLDPEEWYVDSPQLNMWDAPVAGGNKVTMYQTKFTAKRKHPELILQPARSDGWIAPTVNISKPGVRDSRTVVIVGDHQAPFHDTNLHRLFCEWMEYNQPDEGVHLGDLMDFPDISRHKPDPENVAYANECLQAGYDILRGVRTASPGTIWRFMPGNHDIRIRDYEIKHAPGIYELSVVATPSETSVVAHSLPHLLRLDELGIEYIDPHGPYEDGQVTLSKHLAVFHGWKASQGSGKTALDTLKQTGFSIIIGHTHRQSIVHHTTHDINRDVTTLMACEAGSMCQVDNQIVEGRRFPSFTSFPDWQSGFAVATIWDDGKFVVDLAKYVNKTLLYREQRFV